MQVTRSLLLTAATLLASASAQASEPFLLKSVFQRPIVTYQDLSDSDDFYLLSQGPNSIIPTRWEFFPRKFTKSLPKKDLTEKLPTREFKNFGPLELLKLNFESTFSHPDLPIKISDYFLFKIGMYQKDLDFEKYSKEERWNKIESAVRRQLHTRDSIRYLSAKDLLSLSSAIVRNQISPELVDEVYEVGSHDTWFYWDIGQGDCDKYSSLTAAVFYTLKEIAENTEHLYVLEASGVVGTKENFSGHAWLQVIGLHESGSWYYTHIDTTWSDGHLFKSDNGWDDDHRKLKDWKLKFYDEINSPWGVLTTFKSTYKTYHGDNLEIKNRFYYVMSALAKLGWYDQLYRFDQHYRNSPYLISYHEAFEDVSKYDFRGKLWNFLMEYHIKNGTQLFLELKALPRNKIREHVKRIWQQESYRSFREWDDDTGNFYSRMMSAAESHH